MNAAAVVLGCCCVLLGALAPGAEAVLPAAEINALRALYKATGGAAWKNNSGWLVDGTDPCSWFGVQCAVTGGQQHVSELLISNNNLVGTLPDEIGSFTQLTAIDFGLNKLTGALPASFSTLKQLYAISLKENSLSGPLDFSQMSKLQFAHLDFNSFSGTLDKFCPCYSLKVLGLVNNAMSGNIPECFVRFTYLQTLHLGGNKLTGPVPAFMAESLRSLDLSRNQLRGAPALGRLMQASGITEVDYFGNKLSGPISGLAKHPSLVVLDVHDNQHSGSVPAEYATSLPSLYVLRAQNNKLSGFLPDAFARSTVASFDFTGNQLYCPLPNMSSGGKAACSYWRLQSANPNHCRAGSTCYVVVAGDGFVVGERARCRFGSAAEVAASVVSAHELRCVVKAPQRAQVQLQIVVDGRPVSANTLPFEFTADGDATTTTTTTTTMERPLRGAEAAPVRVRIHGESKCPDFGSIATIFKPILHSLGTGVVDLQLGWIMKELPEYAMGYWSLHGQAEVIGNAMISCVGAQHNITAAVDFATCLAEQIDAVPTNAPACASKLGFDYDAVRACAFADQGAQLLHDAMVLSNKDGAVWSPTILINDKLFCLWHSTPCQATSEQDFLRAVCAAYTGPKPAGCQ